MAFLWDARRASRTAVNTRVIVECDGRWYRGTAVDLNEYGVGVSCPLTVHPGQKITVSFCAFEDGSNGLKLEAMVRHGHSMRYGCEFVAVSEADRAAIQVVIATTKVTRRGSSMGRAAVGM